MLPGDAAQAGSQPRLLTRTDRLQAPLGRAMLAGDPTGVTLGHPEAGLQVPNGPAAPLRG
jgi:hypothetical protein